MDIFAKRLYWEEYEGYRVPVIVEDLYQAFVERMMKELAVEKRYLAGVDPTPHWATDRMPLVKK